MNCNPRLNAAGFTFEFTILDCKKGVRIPLETSLSKKIHFKKPDGAIITRDATFKTDGKDSIVSYTTESSDLDKIGKWHVQYAIDLPSFSSGTSVESFDVVSNIF